MALGRGRWRGRAAAALGAAVLVASCTSGDGDAEPSDSPLEAASSASGGEIVDEDAGFAITFPDDWQVSTQLPQLEVVGLSPFGDDAFQNNVGVLLEELPPDQQLSLDEYVEVSVDAAPEVLEGFELEQTNPRELGGQAGTELVYTGETDGGPRKFLAVVTVVDGRAYTVTYTAEPSTFDDTLAAANEVIDSFTLL